MNKNWRKYHGALIPLSPPHQLVSESDIEINNLVKSNNSFFARWTSEFDCNKITPFWHVINDIPMQIEDYSAKTRNQIRRGLKTFEIKKIDKKIIFKKGFAIYAEAFRSYDTIFDIESQKEYLKNLEGEWEFWGVFFQNVLVGYSQNKIFDNYCDYSTIKILPQYNKSFCFYALFFTMNKYYLVTRKLKYVTDGARSISHKSNIQQFLISKFKFRKAYCKLEISYHPIVAIIVKLFFPIRNLFKFGSLNLFLKIFIVLKQEETKRLSDKIFTHNIDSENTLVLSNGNFKSGSTWVTAIIKELLSYKANEFPFQYQNPKHKNWINRFKIPKFVLDRTFENQKYWLSKSHIFQKKLINELMVFQDNIKVININRDLRDVLVSHFYHLQNSKKYYGDFNSYFYSWGKYKAMQYLLYNKAWENASCLRLSYLELKNNNIDTIKIIASYLEIPITNKQALNIQKETDINKLRESSKEKNLNEEAWFYRKGIVGDWKNHFDEKMLEKLKTIQLGNLNWNERLGYFIKFTFRIKLKFLLYRFSPNLYIYFDKKF